MLHTPAAELQCSAQLAVSLFHRQQHWKRNTTSPAALLASSFAFACPLSFSHLSHSLTLFIILSLCRKLAERLAAALQHKDEAAACQLLCTSDPATKLAWVRDPHSGGYPSHIAAWHGLADFLKQLVAQNGEHTSGSM